MKSLLSLLTTIHIYAFTIAQTPQDIVAVKSVLTMQIQAWNNGDLDGYMQGYWKSDSLTFIGKKGVTKGWQQTLDNYKKSYPDKSAMGQLGFELISIEQLSQSDIYVVGKWNLTRDKKLGDLSGHFTLLLKKINSQWVIVSDHSS